MGGVPPEEELPDEEEDAPEEEEPPEEEEEPPEEEEEPPEEEDVPPDEEAPPEGGVLPDEEVLPEDDVPPDEEDPPEDDVPPDDVAPDEPPPRGAPASVSPQSSWPPPQPARAAAKRDPRRSRMRRRHASEATAFDGAAFIRALLGRPRGVPEGRQSGSPRLSPACGIERRDTGTRCGDVEKEVLAGRPLCMSKGPSVLATRPSIMAS
jgi:hypothetical protein